MTHTDNNKVQTFPTPVSTIWIVCQFQTDKYVFSWHKYDRLES